MNVLSKINIIKSKKNVSLRRAHIAPFGFELSRVTLKFGGWLPVSITQVLRIQVYIQCLVIISLYLLLNYWWTDVYLQKLRSWDY